MSGPCPGTLPRRRTEMPDAIRKRCASTTHPWRRRLLQAHAAAAALLISQAARADEALRPVNQVLGALATLDRYDLAALTLTLGVILFAVVTAIALLRTRKRMTQLLAAKQSEVNDLREERDRANALLLAEPQVIVVWPAGGDEPDIAGDPAIVTRTALPRRVLAFGTWLQPDQAQVM